LHPILYRKTPTADCLALATPGLLNLCLPGLQQSLEVALATSQEALDDLVAPRKATKLLTPGLNGAEDTGRNPLYFTGKSWKIYDL